MNRTGTYVAFDALGQTDPTKSDYKYYALIQAWSENEDFDFSLVNSHEKTYQVRDSSSEEVLRARIQQRLRASKNMLVILTSQTRKRGSMLSYEIAQAIDNYKIPLIIAYPEFRAILGVGSKLEAMWPIDLQQRIDVKGTQAIHIPFKQEPILDAVPRFTVNGEQLKHGRVCYSRETYVSWGLLKGK